MPCFTFTRPDLEQEGPVIDVFVAPSSVLRKQLEASGVAVPEPIKKRFLIDTGASCTVMKTGTAAELGLIAKGQTTIHTPSSKDFQCFTFDIDLIVPNQLTVPNLLVCESPMAGQSIDGLLGRDVLTRGMLVYTGYAYQFTLAV